MLAIYPNHRRMTRNMNQVSDLLKNCQILQDPQSGNRIIMMAGAWAVRDRV